MVGRLGESDFLRKSDLAFSQWAGVSLWEYANTQLGIPGGTPEDILGTVGCTERSTHTCARVPADLAQAPDGGGKVGGGSG